MINDIVDIAVELFDEGVATMILTKAEKLKNGLYKVLPPSKYDPEDIIMAFPPGSVVRLENRGKYLLACPSNPNTVRIEIERPGKILFFVSTFAESLGEGLYKVLAQTNYNEKEHSSEFPPGSIVRLAEKKWNDTDTYLTPIEKVK